MSKVCKHPGALGAMTFDNLMRPEDISRDLGLLPESRRTEKICAKVFQANVHNIKHIPAKFLNEDICALAASRGALVEDMPVEFRSPRVCLIAMNQDHCRAVDVPLTAISLDLFKEFKKHNAFTHVPETWIPILRGLASPELDAIIRGKSHPECMATNKFLALINGA